MAEVYDFVPGVPGNKVSHVMPNGSKKHNKANQLERVIALHEDVQNAVMHEGRFIFRRADFRMKAAQERHLMKLREDVADAIKTGDPDLIAYRQKILADYNINKTKVTWAKADVDFHISLMREDGREFHVEVENDDGRGGLSILRESLKM